MPLPPALPSSALVPFHATVGPRHPKIALVGEAFGETEERTGMPFMGYSGKELTQMLGEAGFRRSDCLLTNVFPFRPPQNQIEALCDAKSVVGKDYKHAPLRAGKYVLPEYLGCLERLAQELHEAQPNLVVALGGTACWALLGHSAITRARGVVAPSTLVPGLKVLPTFHPAAVLRAWQQRPIVVADLMKAKLEMEFPEIRRTARRLLVNPTLEELEEWWTNTGQSAALLASDIETKAGQITMISFAESPLSGVVVPFWLPTGSYWATLQEELLAWQFVRKVLESAVPKLWQNGLYDLQYLYRMGLRPRNCQEDTMLLHHSLYPELPKSLAFLGSIYANEGAWKDMRRVKEEKKER